MCIDGDGKLTISPLGLDRVNTEWDLDPKAPKDEPSRFGDPGAGLSERLIRVGPRP